VVVATAATAAYVAVATISAVGRGNCISKTGISNLGGSGVSVSVLISSVSFGRSKSLGGTIIILYDGTSAVGNGMLTVSITGGFGKTIVGRVGISTNYLGVGKEKPPPPGLAGKSTFGINSLIILLLNDSEVIYLYPK
tara:strand:- start:122 stop:535 length:414 start_codon:yes stop_codon:yes gene_type:complete